MKRALALFLLLAAAAPPGARADNALAAIAQSAKSIGRGGAEAAVGDDVLTSTSNPATLMDMTRVRFDGAIGLGLDRVRTTDHFSDNLDNEFARAPHPALGIAWDPLAPDAATDEAGALAALRGSDLRLAFTIWTPMQFVVAPTVAVSWRLTDSLSIGAAANLFYTRLDFSLVQDVGEQGEDDFRAEGKMFIYRQPDGTPVSPPQPFTAGTSTQVSWQEIFDLAALTTGDPNQPPPVADVKIRRVEGFGAGGQLGLLFAPLPDLKLGLGFRSPGFIFRPKGRISIDLEKTILSLKADPQVATILQATVETFLPAAGAQGFKQDYDFTIDDIRLPMVGLAGVAWTPLPTWLLALDLRYINWAGSFKRVRITGKNGTNPDFNEIVGGPTLRYTFPMRWKDQWVVAVGTAAALTDWLILRAGYNHGTPAVPKAQLYGDTLGTLDHLTFGAGVPLASWELNLGYVYGLPRRIELAASASHSEQHLFYFGASYRF